VEPLSHQPSRQKERHLWRAETRTADSGIVPTPTAGLGDASNAAQVKLRRGLWPPRPGFVLGIRKMVRPSPLISGDALWCPSDNVLPACEVQQWLVWRKGQAGGFGHRVEGEFRPCNLQLPRVMMNVAAVDPPARVRGIQAISFGQKMLSGSPRCLENFSGRPVLSLQDTGGRISMRSFAGILNPSVRILTLHPRTEIGQMKPPAGNRHGSGISRIKAEEPNTGLALRHHVRPHIQFWKSREPRQGRRPTEAHTGHPKRYNRDPRLPLEGIDLQRRGNVRAQQRRIHTPMREQQVVPRLSHSPRPLWQRPWPMRCPIRYAEHQS
jgi:hypothetical protein